MSEMNPILETERLTLRLLEPGDATLIEQLAGAPEIARTTLHVPHPYPEGGGASFVAATREAAATGKSFTFAMLRKEDGQLLGVMGLGVSKAHQSAELGYWVGHPFWGQGYATEAARRVMAFGFEELGLNRVWAAFMMHNPASGKVMQKIGMQYEGTRRQDVLKWGQFYDLGLYGILRSEYFKQAGE